MKKIVLVVVMAIGGTFLMSFSNSHNEKEVKTKVGIMESNYNEGWKDGYCEGWKDVKGKHAYCPYAPYPPYPKYPKSIDSYRDGYNDGFKRGMRDARK